MRIKNLEINAQAIKDYNRAIELNPNDDRIFQQGLSHSMSGNYEQAIKDYDKFIESDRGDSVAYYNRGIAYSSSGKYHQAIKDFDKAID
jgi:tetratricopeptide (TPR) repeat protein